MKKYILDLRVASVDHPGPRHVLLKLTDADPLPAMLPGQFVEVRVDDSPSTFLRRPVSIHFVDPERNELWLLVAAIGPGTRRLAALRPGDTLNCVLPLGNSFRTDYSPSPSEKAPSGEHPADIGPEGNAPEVLLVGGGVGVAPLLYYGRWLSERGIRPTFLLGARTEADLLMLSEYNKYGRVCVTTEDGSAGERGLVTDHSVLRDTAFTHISTCGPKPMMMAVARYARQRGIPCEASLENMMACGLGACLCCVEKTTQGNLCVCKDGPVFDVNRLLW